MNNFRLTVEELPELETEVAVSGALKQQEVFGPVCLGVILGVICGM